MHSAHATLLVDHKPGGPCFDSIRIPDRIVVVRNYRIMNAQRGNFAPHVVDIAFALKLGRMYADDCQSFVAIARIPTLYVRQSVAAVVATERPEIDYDDTAQIGRASCRERV